MDKKKVLLIDDEEKFTSLLKLNLEGTGQYEVMVLSDAKVVCESVRKFLPDIILVDLIMPQIGGLEVCEMLNNDDFGSKTPIIVLSALGKTVDKLKAFKLGVVDYLVKPIETKDVITAIEKALEFKKGGI